MTNVYRIGVSIAMANGVSPVLGVLARDVLGLHGKVGALEKGFGRLKLAIGGALGIWAGAKVLGGMAHMLSAAEDLSREQGKMLAAGLKQKDVAEATGRAWEMSGKIMGARVSENLAAIGHLRAAIGDLHEAERVAPAYQRNAVALSAILKRDGEPEAFKLAQAIHLSGAANDPITKRLDADTFSRQMNLYTAMIAAGQGKLSPQDVLQFQKMAGSYGGNLSNEGRINLVGYMQSIGGSRAGTSLSSLNRALKDGVLQKSTLAQLESIGLIDPSKVITAGGKGIGNGASPGGGIRLLPGALANEKQFMADPAQWVWSTLVGKMREKGITSTDDQINWIQKAKLTTNPTRLLAELIRNQGVDMQEAANVRQASKVDQYGAVMGRDLGANQDAFKKAWTDFMTAVATPLVPAAIHALQAMTGAVKGVTQWARIHPGAVKLIGGAIVVLGAALIGFGAVAIGVAAFAAVAAGGTVGLVVAGIGAVIGAVTALVVLNWGAVKSAAASIWSFVKTIADVVGFIMLHPFQAAGQIIGAVMPVGSRKVTAEEAARANQNPFSARVKPGDSVFDLGGRGFGPGGFGFSAANSNRPSAAPPPRKPGQAVQVHTQINMDGRKVAKVVSTHQAEAAGHKSGPGRHDPRASLPAAGAGGSR